ncbi:hypothetical protein FHR99_000442 [Litorivivens lipolytica]|uniref:Uncharacterized protein n=1 Tax=Litorivivens lipolytica TaxID=1524264 RepID=A0A7W4W2H1_9GAMM|nr:hypothetical protein [Litorivivens lipolytica]
MFASPYPIENGARYYLEGSTDASGTEKRVND